MENREWKQEALLKWIMPLMRSNNLTMVNTITWKKIDIFETLAWWIILLLFQYPKCPRLHMVMISFEYRGPNNNNKITSNNNIIKNRTVSSHFLWCVWRGRRSNLFLFLHDWQTELRCCWWGTRTKDEFVYHHLLLSLLHKVLMVQVPVYRTSIFVIL